MKRSAALQSLSRDHHAGLVVAQRLRRATPGTAAQVRDAFLDYWRSHGQQHFRSEEEILLPAYAGVGAPGHPLVVRVLVDHLTIRSKAADIAREPEQPPAALQELGVALADHIRVEERELFPLIEDALPAAELALVAAELEQAEAATGR